jgi:hypothetical protein
MSFGISRGGSDELVPLFGGFMRRYSTIAQTQPFYFCGKAVRFQLKRPAEELLGKAFTPQFQIHASAFFKKSRGVRPSLTALSPTSIGLRPVLTKIGNLRMMEAGSGKRWEPLHALVQKCLSLVQTTGHQQRHAPARPSGRPIRRQIADSLPHRDRLVEAPLTGRLLRKLDGSINAVSAAISAVVVARLG